jgi:hypothetical protein
VQFVRFTNNSTFTIETAMAGHVMSCTGPSGASNGFVFPSSLSGSTLNKNLLIGTSNLATIPGGLTPDYFFTSSTPFLLLTPGVTNTIGILNSSQLRASYTNLPTDGVLSLYGPSNNLAIRLAVSTNSPQNYAGQSNSIVPVKFLSAKRSGTNFVMSFRTATGVNGSAGPNYSVEFKHDLSDSSWNSLTTFPGNGSTQSVSNALSSADHRLFHLNAH